MHEHDESRLPEPGDTYEGFEIVRQLGAGSFAAVYEVRSPRFAEPVALKLSRTPLVSQEVAVRALREIKVMSSLTSDHVAQIYDHGLGADERWYIVMEFLRGKELTDAHDFDQPMEPARAVDLVYQACMGLEEAHRAGIVHRDLKPDNMWLHENGTVKVLDFGLARAWGEDAGETMAATATAGHVLVGTPHYSQPEQIQSGQLLPASDVYSLGIILYELLAGRVPLFEDEPISVVRARLIDEPLQWLLAHVNRPLVPITRYLEGQALPTELVELLHATLAKDPSQRPPSAGDLANRLGRILHRHYGKAIVAVLCIDDGGGGGRQHVLTPGTHRVGFGGRCEVVLPAPHGTSMLALPGLPRIAAILEWAGVPNHAELRPLRGDGTITLNERPLTASAKVGPADRVGVAGVRITISYPR